VSTALTVALVVGAVGVGSGRASDAASGGVEVASPTASSTPTRTPVPTPTATADAAALDPDTVTSTDSTPVVSAPAATTALALLDTISVKGRAPKTGYDREGQFGTAWIDVDRNGCDTRNDILARDLVDEVLEGSCKVLTGSLADPYTATTIAFVRGNTTSTLVQIDHVVALSDAWQKGAQQLDQATRIALANDPLNLLAVDGPTNSSKGDGDAATWLPPSTAFRCAYVARQVSVKAAYTLWMTQAEHDAIARVLATCPEQAAEASGFAPVVAPAPVVEAPVAQAPVTQAPVAQAPVVQDPVAQAPVVVPVPVPVPVTPAVPDAAAPVVETPAVETPTVETPVAEAPVEQPPVAETPVETPVVTPEPEVPVVPVPVEPAPAPVVEAPAPPPATPVYANCDAVRAAGAAPIHPGDPGWQDKFDRDKDGIGCDT
jgi:hypothetical protein